MHLDMNPNQVPLSYNNVPTLDYPTVSRIASIQYTMFDVHYYLKPEDLVDNPITNGCLVHVTGGNFHTLPGKYYLPNGEGSYRIYQKR